MNDVVITETPLPSADGALGAARTAAGLTVADVARQLNLSTRQVEALESGDYARLPGTIFVRGFIRNYARLLKLDPAPLLAVVQVQSAVPVVVEPSAQSAGVPFPGQSSLNWRPYAIGALLVFSGLAAYEFYGGEPAPGGADSNAVVVELPEPKIVNADNVAVPVTQEAPQPAIAAIEMPREAPRGNLSPPATPVAPVAEPRPVVQDRVSGEQSVRMMFSRESWVEVRDRQGRIIFSQLNAAGSAQTVGGQPPLRLVVGNASGVKLMFNDRAIDLAPFTQVDVARLTLE
jgi:cytoskeleton protein RodZ